MNTSRRILIGIVAVLIIGAGLATGVFFSDKAQHERINTPSEAQAKPEPNFNTYEISPPSRGAMLVTVEAPLSVEGDDIVALIAQEEAADIKTGQRVLLYDAQGDALEKFGAVSAVALENDGRAKTTITLGDKNSSNGGLTKGVIITANIPDAPRLPLTAIVQKDGASYIWEANENKDGTHTAYFKRAQITHETKDFFVIEENAASSNVFILKPDAALQDGQKINVKKILYAGPELTEEGRIMLLIANRKREKEREVRMSTPTAQNNAALATCNPNVQTLNGFIESIQKIEDSERKEKISAELLRRAKEREAKKKATEKSQD